MRRLALVLLVLVSALVAVPAALAEHPVTLDDAAGDAGRGPDITRVSVEDTGTAFAFSLQLATMQDLRPDGFAAVFVDTDANVQTGNPNTGAELGVFMGADGVVLVRWNGAWESTPVALAPSLSGGLISFTLPKAIVGSERIHATFVALSESGGNDDVDVAPDDEAVVYPATVDRMLIPGTALLPRAGKVLDARGISVTLTNNAQIETTIRCTLTQGRRVIKPLAGGCRWKLAKNLRGKSLTLTITVTVGNDMTTRALPIKVGR